MKNVLLAITLFASLTAFAVTPQQGVVNKTDKKELIAQKHSSFTKESIGTETLSKKVHLLRQKSNMDSKSIATPVVNDQPMKKANIIKGELYHRLDSLVALDPNGNKYTKEEVKYTNVYLDDQFIQYTWNEGSQEWDPFMTESYTWDEDEWLLAVEIIYVEWDFGQKYEVTYDKERELVLTETSSFWDSQNGWQLYEHLVREFDSNDNPIVQTAYLWEDGEWVNNVKRESVYDNEHREIDVKVWYWDNDAWVGDFRSQYEFDQWGHHTLRLHYDWDAAENDWVYYLKAEQEFIAFEKLIFQLTAPWNPDLQDWVGLDWNPAIKADLTYDDQLREIEDVASVLVNYTTWVKSVAIETEYEDYQEGGFQSVAKMYFYDDEGEERELTNIDTFTYDGLDRQTLEHHEYFADWLDQWIVTFTISKTYEGTNPEPILVEQWEDDNGTLMPGVKLEYEYDEDYKVTLFKSYMRDWGNTEPAWVPLNKTEYQYIEDILVREYKWSWNGQEWEANYGEGIDIDLTFPLTSLIIPMYYYSYDFKVEKRYLFEGIDGTLDFNTYEITFHWSEQTLPTNVNIIEDSQISVYPNPTQGMVYINSDEHVMVRVYSINGMLMMQTTEKQIDLSAFAPGMYIFDVNGYKTKIIRTK